MAGLILAAGLVGGAAGGIAGRVREPVTPADTTLEASATPFATTSAGGLVRAVERANPAVVTVMSEVAATSTRAGSLNAGTGIILTEDGLILTNYHVVDGAERITVVMPSGERRPAQVIADDAPFQDMAILSIPAGGLKPAVLGSSGSLHMGEGVAVIASGVYAFENQVKAGVVSSLKRAVSRPGSTLVGMVQTDAAVNHGDSGGALINTAGEVVGLVTTIVRDQPSGDLVEGVAFAHAIDDLKGVIDGVRATGQNPRPRLGIERLGSQHRLLTDAEAARFRLRSQEGILVTRVEPGSPAEAAGIVVGDVIAAVDQIRITADAPFPSVVAAAGGREMRLTVLRGTSATAVAITPRPLPAVRRQ